MSESEIEIVNEPQKLRGSGKSKVECCVRLVASNGEIISSHPAGIQENECQPREERAY
jgi:hypothetical protein